MRIASSAGAFAAFAFYAATATLFATPASATATDTATTTAPNAPSTVERPFRRHDYRLTFKRPYYFNGTIPYWQTVGNVVEHKDFIRLASNVPGLKGSIWAIEPNKHPEWEVEFSFIVSGPGTAGGNGLAFWYTKDRAQDGPMFGNTDKWDGLGVFFSTYDEVNNRNNPLVYGAINDGHRETTKAADLDKFKFGSCWRDIRNPVGHVWVRVSYFNNRLAVEVDTIDKGKSYVPCFVGQNIGLPVGNYFGLSAMAGKHADNHDVISFETYEFNPKIPSKHAMRPHEQEKIDHGNVFEMTEEDKKHIEEIELKVEQIRQEEEEKRNLGHVDILGLNAQLHETQSRILESLDALHGKLAHLGAPDKPQAMPANIEDRLSMIIASITSVSSQLKIIATAVTALTNQMQEIRNSGASGGSSQKEDVLPKLYQLVEDLQSKFEIFQSRHEAQYPITGGGYSSIIPYVIGFAALQAAIIWFLGRRKPKAPKKFI